MQLNSALTFHITLNAITFVITLREVYNLHKNRKKLYMGGWGEEKCHFHPKADNLFPDSKELSLITSWKVIYFFTLNLFLY